MKIGVTTSSGKLGTEVVKQLVQEIGQDNVIGIARTPEKAKHLGIEIRKGNYDNRQDLDIALQGVDAVLLVSGMDEPQKRIQQHRNVIEAAKLNGVKKIVYTSIVGDEHKTAFSPIVKSNRQTEKDIQESGLEWVIGRNGIYIEPDMEHIDHYVKDGEVRNCAGDGKCAYTSRKELGYAYTQMLIGKKHNNQVYNLVGEPISQSRLAEIINQVYQTNLIYNPVSIAAYEKERREALGEFLGNVIAGIYEGIRTGAYDVSSDFEKAAGRPHKPAPELIRAVKNG